MSVVPHLCIQQVEVLSGVLQPSLSSNLRLTTLRTDQLIYTALLNSYREESCEAHLTQEAGTVSHGDNLEVEDIEEVSQQLNTF